MTVSTSTNKITYTGNGTTKEFAVPFLFFKDSHISVRLKPAPASGAELVILRTVPYAQETRYIDGDPMPAALLERNLDALTMMCQQLKEQADRTVTLDIFSDADPSALIDKVEVLYADKDALDLIAGNMDALKTDADNIGDVKTAADNIEAVKTAAGSIAAVKTVSDAVNDVVLCAAEIAAIKDAPNQAAAAGASASAALASQNAAGASAEAAAASASEAANRAQASAASAADAAASAADAKVGLATDAEFSAGTATNKAPTVKQAAGFAPKAMFQVVSALPASPDPDVFYFIPE